MRTGSTPAKSRTILCMRAVPGMARGVRRRLLPQPSRLGRRRIVLTGPSLPSPLLLSGLQSCRRLVRRHQNRDRRPLWVIGLPCQTRGRSLRQADYPQLPRSTHPTTNLAATSSLLSCDDFIEYAHFQTVIDRARSGGSRSTESGPLTTRSPCGTSIRTNHCNRTCSARSIGASGSSLFLKSCRPTPSSASAARPPVSWTGASASRSRTGPHTMTVARTPS